MILADKIIQLRKKNGWSQEELAEQMGVSRQAVCKWEGAQSIPDINKLIQLSQLFGVSTDYLLKDEIEEMDINLDTYQDAYENGQKENVHFVSMEEANAFLKAKEETVGKIAFGVFLCILSPIALFLLAGAQECQLLPITEDAAGGLGMLILIMLVAPAVALFVQSGMKTGAFEYLESETIETQYGVTGMVKERRENFRDVYVRNITFGVCMCVISVVPLFGSTLFVGNEFYEIVGLCMMLLIVAIGVYFIIKASIPWESMKKLLQEGDYSVAEKDKKRRRKVVVGPVSGIYWMVVTAIFLVFVMTQRNMSFSHAFVPAFWSVSGILFVAVVIVCKMIEDRREKK